MSVTLTKEQAAMLLPLLTQTVSAGESSGGAEEGPNYSIAEMFTKKKKNTRCTPAQNYLLVSQIVPLLLEHVNYACTTTTRLVRVH